MLGLYLFNNIPEFPLSGRPIYPSGWARSSNKKPPKRHRLNKNLFFIHATCTMQSSDCGGWGKESENQSDQGTQAKGSFISTWSPWTPRLWEGCGEDSTGLEGHYPDTWPFCLHFIGQSKSHWTSGEQGSERLSWKYLVNCTNDHYTSLSLTHSFIWQIHTEHLLCMYGALEIQQR